MIRLLTRTLMSLVFVAVFQSAALAQESFPFLAEAIQNGVNVRAGGNQNFERLTQINQGEEVVVVSKNFAWYKVELPRSAVIYVSDKYFKKLSDTQGQIT